MYVARQPVLHFSSSYTPAQIHSNRYPCTVCIRTHTSLAAPDQLQQQQQNWFLSLRRFCSLLRSLRQSLQCRMACVCAFCAPWLCILSPRGVRATCVCVSMCRMIRPLLCCMVVDTKRRFEDRTRRNIFVYHNKRIDKTLRNLDKTERITVNSFVSVIIFSHFEAK